MPAGRPTDYDPAYVEQASKLCALGATDMEMADFFGVSVSTFYLWKNVHPEFSEAIKVSKETADNRVERSLYERAVGYAFDSEKIFQSQGEVIRAKTREHVPPDTTAQIFWLKNRKRDQWADTQKHEHGGELKVTDARERIASTIASIAARSGTAEDNQQPE